MATAMVARNEVFSDSTSESVASEAEDSPMEAPGTPRAALPLKAPAERLRCAAQGDVEVVIGTSLGRATPRQVASLCNEAYGCRRLSEADARSRLAMGDDDDPNRVLHLAFREGQLLGCCSSTLQPPWTPRGCGHWGLLSVHPEAQGTGVASALIAAAERRLLEEGCSASDATHTALNRLRSHPNRVRIHRRRPGVRAPAAVVRGQVRLPQRLPAAAAGLVVSLLPAA